MSSTTTSPATTGKVLVPRSAPSLSSRLAARLRGGAATAGWGLLGFAGFIAFWAIVATRSPDLPTPSEAWSTLQTMLSGAFHDNGPNDRGIALQLKTSLGRVFTGFVLASALGIVLGFALGASSRAWRALNPIVQLLRPVSPLAWFPIGLVVFQAAPSASVFVIFITALWPTLINTAFGVASVPQDHKNVARVFKFSKPKYVRHVLLPYSLPSMLTGMRISMGIAWMVIVAVEMLAGGEGIGFFVWDSYNAGNLSQVVGAIFCIGAVGVVLDLALGALQRRTAFVQEG